MEDTANVKNPVLGIIKGVLISVTATLILILLFSLIIRWGNLPDGVILPVNQVIKALAIGLGCFMGITDAKKGLLKGLIIGLSVTVVNYLVFSVIASDWNFTWKTVLDAVSGCTVGGICGIIAVNTKREK